MAAGDRILPAAAVRAAVAHVLGAAGSHADEAQAVAANLVLANLSGHDSHGVGMVPRYVDAVLEGGLVPNASARPVHDAGPMLAFDGQRGYGQVVGVQALEQAIARAQALGCCTMTLAQAHHLGRIGHFAELAVAAGLVSLHFVNVLARPTVAPWGGADGRFGTNPLCIGIPLAGREPFVLDLATSRVAQGKMRVAHNRGETVADGLLIDPQGRPTRDPGVVVVPQADGLLGALRTFGEHKGYGLAVACELLGGALSGGGTWHRAADSSRAVHNGMLTLLIDPRALGAAQVFEREAQAFVDWLAAAPAAPGVERVLLAGDPERSARIERERSGIAIDAQTWAELDAAADKVGTRFAA